MASIPSLTTLAQRLLKSAEKLDASPGDNQAYWSDELVATRTDMLEALFEIQTRVQSPVDLLEQHQINYNSFACLKWLLHFNIFTHVPLDYTPITYTSLSTLASVPLKLLQSVVRMSILSGLFIEPEPALIAHSPLSMSFATDPRLRNWGTFIAKYGAPAAQVMDEATERWGDTDAKNETAYNIFSGSATPFFDHLKQKPGMADLFAKYMEGQLMSQGQRLQHLLDGFDWSSLNSEAHVVDVGGSAGFVSVALARAHPKFLFTVQDLPTGIGSPSTLADLPASVSSRIRFVAHDFFDPQPPIQADWPPPDVYLLRKILHDWPQSQARRILCQIAVALRDGGNPTAKIIIMDTILPVPETIGKRQQAKIRVRDLTMAQDFNSYERELSEWKELLESTVPKLALLNWNQPPESFMAVMEVGLDC